MNKSRNRLLIPSIILILIMTLTPGDGKIAGNYLDKLAHFLVFFLLALNLCYKFKNKYFLIESLLWAMQLGFLTEILQEFIPGRNKDIFDGIANTTGIIAGYYFYRFFKRQIEKIALRLGA